MGNSSALLSDESGFAVYGLRSPSTEIHVAPELGSKIILPPKFEAQREAIEKRLTPLPDPRADWAPAER